MPCHYVRVMYKVTVRISQRNNNVLLLTFCWVLIPTFKFSNYLV